MNTSTPIFKINKKKKKKKKKKCIGWLGKFYDF